MEKADKDLYLYRKHGNKKYLGSIFKKKKFIPSSKIGFESQTVVLHTKTFYNRTLRLGKIS
jgi:hypothetical protein